MDQRTLVECAASKLLCLWVKFSISFSDSFFFWSDIFCIRFSFFGLNVFFFWSRQNFEFVRLYTTATFNFVLELIWAFL